MRKIATVASPSDNIRRVMTYATDGGAYLFMYTKLEDGPCEFDQWHDSLVLAEQDANERFGLTADDWTVLNDPLPGAQDDWIRPTRVKCDAAGNKLWGQFEAMTTAG